MPRHRGLQNPSNRATKAGLGGRAFSQGGWGPGALLVVALSLLFLTQASLPKDEQLDLLGRNVAFRGLIFFGQEVNTSSHSFPCPRCQMWAGRAYLSWEVLAGSQCPGSALSCSTPSMASCSGPSRACPARWLRCPPSPPDPEAQAWKHGGAGAE